MEPQRDDLPSIFSCTKCRYFFLAWRNMLHHLRVWHTNNYYSNICVCCEREFVDRRAFLAHLKMTLSTRL